MEKLRTDKADDGARLHAQGKAAHRAFASLVGLGKILYLQHTFFLLANRYYNTPPRKKSMASA